MTTATARNVGPVSEISIPIPDGGGIVVFRGANGTGKSTVLDTIQAAVSGSGKVPVRDGALNAQFDGFGVTMKIGRSARRIGECEVHSLESRFDLSALVDPGIADPEKADAHRIKALVALVSAKADAELFYPLAGGPDEFDAIVSPAAVTHTDLLLMAGAIKRDFEAASRKAANEAGTAKARADAARKSAEGVDVAAKCDGAALQKELEIAVGAKAKIEAEQLGMARTIRAAEASRQQLNRSRETYTGPSAEDAADADGLSRRALALAESAVRAAQLALRDAERSEDAARREASAAAGVAQSAKQHAEMIATWQAQIDAAASLAPVNAGDVIRAQGSVEDAREAVENGAIVRRAKAALVAADVAEEERATHEAEADALRNAAKGVDDVLSSVVAKSGVPLRIEPVENRMRLTLETKRGRTCFGELSDGERWRLALDIAIQAVGQGGEITLAQHAWEGLDFDNRRAIAQQARDGGILIYTAQADEGELRAEIFNPNGDHAHH